MKVSKDKKYKTRDGRDVVIYEVYDKEKLFSDSYVVHGVIIEEDGGVGSPTDWRIDGTHYKVKGGKQRWTRQKSIRKSQKLLLNSIRSAAKLKMN